MASAIKKDDKYKETAYRHKKATIDISNINISIGSKIYNGDKLYGTVIDESNLFYYLINEEAKAKEESLDRIYEPCDFRKESLKEKIANGILRLER